MNTSATETIKYWSAPEEEERDLGNDTDVQSRCTAPNTHVFRSKKMVESHLFQRVNLDIFPSNSMLYHGVRVVHE